MFRTIFTRAVWLDEIKRSPIDHFIGAVITWIVGMIGTPTLDNLGIVWTGLTYLIIFLAVSFSVTALRFYWRNGSPSTVGTDSKQYDNRKGNFNSGANYGSQVFYEAPARRRAPGQLNIALTERERRDLVVQVRVYGMEHEMRIFGDDLLNSLRRGGINAEPFGEDHGTRLVKGVLIEPTNSELSRKVATAIATSLIDHGIQTTINTFESKSSDNFVRLGIGANV